MNIFVVCFILFLSVISQEPFLIEKDNMIDANQIHSRYHTEFWNGNVSAYDFTKTILISKNKDLSYNRERLFSDSTLTWFQYDEVNLLLNEDSVYWIKFSLENNLNNDLSAYLFFNAWKKIELYSLDSAKNIVEKKVTGNYLKLAERNVKNRRIPFIKTTIRKAETKTYAVRLLRGGDEFWFDDSNKKIASLLYHESKILEKENTLRLFLGLSVGLIVTIILFNFLLFFITKNLSALYNGLFLVFWELFYISTYGISFEYLWPNSVFWDFHSHSFFVAFCIASLCQFFRYSLNLSETNKNYDKFFNYLSTANLLIIITQLLDLRDWNELFINLLFTMTFISGIIINYKSWKKGNKAAKYYLIGISYMHVFQIFIGLSQNDVLPYFYGAITNLDFAQYAASVQVALYSYGLVIAYKESMDEVINESSKRSIAEIKAQSYKELEENKSRFFSTISHEFRTPLSLILGSIETIEENKSENENSYFYTIKNNAKRLLRLINQLLDFSKIEEGKMTVSYKKYDLKQFVSFLLSHFKSATKDKGVVLKFNSNLSELVCDLDYQKIEKVIINIISNAIKFTNEGVIEVELILVDSEWIEILICDTGIGISENDINYIFDRFYQVENQYYREYEGTGIGLALSKELIDLHNGEIRVESKLAEGTCFKIILPFQNDPSVERYQNSKDLKPTDLEISSIQIDQSETNETEAINGEKKKTILIIEDHKEMRSFIKSILKSKFQIIEAHNGIKGIEMASKYYPDIILTDIMMPKMDGLELIKVLKESFETSHIPIIVISGKATDQDKLEALSYGAIDYLFKPFQKEQLLQKIISISKQFDQFKKRLNQSFTLTVNNCETTNADEQFLFELKEFILNNLQNSEVALICEHFALSESSLFRKIKAITGCGIKSLIQELRLEKSKSLIQSSGKTISEISDICGFNSVSHFSKSFKSQFGISPSEAQQIIS
jgi:signal transduction histidine kinase/DNA-binding response OmpR family regulator